MRKDPPLSQLGGGFASPHGALFATYAHYVNSASRIPAVTNRPPPLRVLPQPGSIRGVLGLWFPLYIFDTVENNGGISASGGLRKSCSRPVALEILRN